MKYHVFVRLIRSRVLVVAGICGAVASVGAAAGQEAPAYLNPSLPAVQRARDLVSRMTLTEKVAQMQNDAPAIPRFHVPAYNWWSEALHGVARAGVATVFPQAIGLAATWDPTLMHHIGAAISLEARAKYEQSMREHGAALNYYGLTEFAPNVNIVRDPRWGRAQETYGEDPFLTAHMGVAYVTGMQGDDPHYVRVIATAKHFDAHSGPETGRSGFDARVSPYDLTDTYLPQFEALVRKAHVASIMTSYNAINGVPVSADGALLSVVRKQWGFDGYFVSDCDAIDVIYSYHHYTSSYEAAAAAALKAGVDLNCGNTYGYLVQAVKEGLVSEAQVDAAVTRLFSARMRLGMFDPPSRVPYAHVPSSAIDSLAHQMLALRSAQESIVLLRNRGLLPLDARKLPTIAVIGPTAESQDVLVGNYNGTPARPVTILAGILARAQAAGTRVLFAPGGFFARTDGAYVPQTTDAYIAQAVRNARAARVAIVVVGNTPHTEGEEGIGDRTSLALPAPQEHLVRAVAATGTPVVLVLTGGSAIAADWESTHVAAILDAWYPGESGGTAVAQVLFGDVNPSGKLPVTIYRSVAQLPPFTDYSMRGRTYRYFHGTPLYAFGYGLSYTTFRYGNPRVREQSPQTGKALHVNVTVRNVGARAGDAVVELYVAHAATPFHAPLPIRALAGMARVSLRPKEAKTVELTVSARSLSLVDSLGRRFFVSGPVILSIGGAQPGPRGAYASPRDGLSTRVMIEGPQRETTP